VLFRSNQAGIEKSKKCAQSGNGTITASGTVS
jgi:hypothetical protein